MNLGENILLEDVPQERRVWQLTAYAEYLIQGGTFFHRRIKSGTIEKYLYAAATLISLATNCDPRKDSATSKTLFQPLTRIIAAYKKWEEQPHRAEPFTPEMQQTLDAENDKHNYHVDSVEVATSDFTGLGLRLGYRSCEYSQSENTKFRIGSHRTVHKDSTESYAFSADDLKFYNQKRIVSQQDIVEAPTSDAAWQLCNRVSYRYPTQKNGQRYETLDYNATRQRKHFCPVYRSVCILRRFHRLVGIQFRQTPLAVYRHPSGEVRYIVRENMDARIKFAAVETYNLDPVKDADFIKAFRSHSLRVGACNILYGNGVAITIIKHRLRWQSDAFMAYFRNIGKVDEVQRLAIEHAIQNPELF